MYVSIVSWFNPTNHPFLDTPNLGNLQICHLSFKAPSSAHVRRGNGAGPARPWEWWELESQMNPTGTQESKRFDVDYPFDMSTAGMGPAQWPKFSKHIQLSQGSKDCDFCNSVAVAKLCQLTFQIWEDFCSFNQRAGTQLGRTSILVS